MTRLAALDPAAATPEARQHLAALQAKLGTAPNLYRTVAHSPATLNAVLGMGAALGKGSLSSRFSEQVALVIAEENGCDYCLSAHTAIGGLLRLPADELSRNRQAQSSDPKVAAGLQFARALVRARGHITATDFAAVQAAGYSDAEIVEIIGHVALNTFTNYFNSAVQTEIDFPQVEAGQPA